MSPDCAGATEDSETLARSVLLPTQRLAGEKPRAVQLRGAAQLHKVRVTGSCQSSPRSPDVSPMSGLLGPNCHGPQLKVCREQERGERAVPGLVIVFQREQPHHLRHQNVAGCNGCVSKCLSS